MTALVDVDGTPMRRDRDGDLIPDRDSEQPVTRHNLRARTRYKPPQPHRTPTSPSSHTFPTCEICGRIEANCRYVESRTALDARHEYRSAP